MGIRLCRPFGCFVWQGNYGDGQISFEFLEAHHRRLRMVFPCDDGYRPYRKASLEAVALGAMPWGEVITHRISHEEMPAFYRDIYRGQAGNVIGAVAQLGRRALTAVRAFEPQADGNRSRPEASRAADQCRGWSSPVLTSPPSPRSRRTAAASKNLSTTS